MAHITFLPYELLYKILSYEDISIKDIVNLSLTCKQLQESINDIDDLWRCKFFQRWPVLKNICERKWRNIDVNNRREVIERMRSRKELLDFFSTLPDVYYYQEAISITKMKYFDSLFRVEEGASPTKYYYLEYELQKFCEEPLNDTCVNLTHIYCAKKTLSYMRQCRLRDKWQQFINLPAKQQILELVATFVAQWCQPSKYIPYSIISETLDGLAQQVLQFLGEQHPTHRIFSTPVQELSSWKDNNIDDNQWNAIESRQILDAIRIVMFEVLRFKVLSSQEFWSSSQHLPFFRSFIDYVLITKRGHVLSIAVIFQSVARRLGIRCDLITFPSHTLLGWKQSYNTEDEKYYYIDVFNNGCILNKDFCPRLRSATSCPVQNILKRHNLLTPIQLIIQLRDYIWPDKYGIRRTILELQYLVEPENMELVLELSSLYIKQNVDLTDAIIMLKKMQSKSSTTTLQTESTTRLQTESITRMLNRIEEILPLQCCDLKERIGTNKLLYGVGMIMEIKANERIYQGVIIGWALERDETEIYNICEETTQQHVLQPAYRLLTSNNQVIHAFQDDIYPIYIVSVHNSVNEGDESVFNHYEIGRYFSHYKKTHYEPNEALKKLYPHDAMMREHWASYLNEQIEDNFSE